MTLQNRYNYLPYFWALTSFLKVLTHAKNIDNHWSSAVIHYFECMVRKTFYSCFLWLRNKKVINFQIFHTLFQKKCWPQQKLWYLAKKCSHHLMQASLKFLCAQFCYDWTKNKEMDKERGQSNGPLSPNLFNLQKAQLL